MAKRWKMNKAPTGLSAVCAGPRSSELSEGKTYLATVSYVSGKWSEFKGWYFVAPVNVELGVIHKNTCNEPVDTEKEAKQQARDYIESCIKNKGMNND